MTFIEPKLDVILEKLNGLSSDKKPLWGNMSAQRMVEHLSESLEVSSGDKEIHLQIPEDKIEGALKHLNSDQPMPRNFKADYAPENVPLRHSEIELAVDELVQKWLDYEAKFENNPELKTLHPIYGNLDFEQWQRMHAKHFTHHFEQFGLI